MDRQTRILIVDDSPTMRTAVEETLRSAGFSSINTASDGTQAWEILKTQQVDIVISDLDMPQMDGLELLAKLRNSEDSAITGFIILSANNETEKVKEAIRLGVDAYIIKPFQQNILLDRVFTLMEKFENDPPLAQANAI